MKKSEFKKLIREIVEVIEDEIPGGKKDNIDPDAKKELIALLRSYKGQNIPDDKIHTLADKHKISPHDVESFIYSIASKHLNEFEDSIPGGKGDSTEPSEVDQKELEVGIKVEREHTDSDEKAKEIAIDHLTENPKYYSKLVGGGLVDEKPALDKAKEVGITESAVGDAYIELGESIDTIDEEIVNIVKIAKKMGEWNRLGQYLVPIAKNLIKLKNELSDSYEFKLK